ncbi:MAG: hypothetical protein WC955_01500 [Elusimicrobiota bacterium]
MSIYRCMVLSMALAFTGIPVYAAEPVKQVVQAEKVFVTKVFFSENGKSAGVVLNDAVEIDEISVNKVSGSVNLKFPVYISKAGKEYPQVSVTDRGLLKRIEDAVSTKNVVPREKVERLSCKITKFRVYTGRKGVKLSVTAQVTINNAVVIECKIRDGKNGPWISWPARPPKDGKKWVKQVRFYDKELSEGIEQLLIKRFNEVKKEEG